MEDNAPEYFLGIDVGTTNAKVVLIDRDARVVRSACCEYAVQYPQPGWAEQDPAIWWSTVRSLVREVAGTFEHKQAIRAAGVSGQMHGLVALDAHDAVIRPAILWNDQRAHAQCAEIAERCGGLDGLLRLTNNNMLAGYTAPKLLWLREHEPEAFRRIAAVLLPKDYLRFKLTGKKATDVSDASGTGLFDVRRRRWSDELIALLDLPRAWFVHAHESTEVVGALPADVASDLGLPAGLPLVAGGGDAALQPLGMGLLDTSEGLLVVGTGGNVTVPLAANIPNEGGCLQIFCGVLPGAYVGMGVTLTAGESLRWIRNLLQVGAAQLGLPGSELTFADLERCARESPPGANRTLFFPYLVGERCPHPDAAARGAFIGLSTRTSLADLVRAILEGVAFSMRDAALVMERQGIRPARWRLCGGGAQNAQWRQIFSNVFDRPIATTVASEGTAYGAALLAGIGQNRWRDPDALKHLFLPQTNDHPDSALAQRYRTLFAVYRQGYDRLSPLFRELAASG
jgi:xylulokinase